MLLVHLGWKETGRSMRYEERDDESGLSKSWRGEDIDHSVARIKGVKSMRLYESLLIIHPELDDEQIDAQISRFSEIITRMEGQLSKVEKWGKKKLAYPVKKQKYGFYLLLRFWGTPALVTELERNYRLMDNVLRALTVRLEKEPAETVTPPDDITDFEEEEEEEKAVSPEAEGEETEEEEAGEEETPAVREEEREETEEPKPVEETL
ncbi:MAG: 30S ribosomal protein S6 [Nitrospinota bacterium]|nr:MAG: 30S ribosomal protein S6 [Nitrospinota bacterium]